MNVAHMPVWRMTAVLTLFLIVSPAISTYGDSMYALEFGGDGDYVRLDHNDSIDLTEAFTFAAWVYVRSWTSPFHQFGGKGDTSWMLRRERGGGDLRLSLRGLEHPFSGSTTAWNMAMDQWVHLAATFDSAEGTAALYVNGHALLEFDGLEGTLNSNPYPFVIGANKEESGSERRFHDGYMSDVRLYNRALSQTEITHVLERTHEVTDGLVVHWKLDEGSGAIAQDSSGRENHGTIIGASWVEVDEPFWEQVDDVAWWEKPGNRIAYLTEPFIGGSISGPDSMGSHDTITFSVTPEPGFTLRSIQSTCGSIAPLNDTEFSLDHVTASSVTVMAGFKPEQPHEPVPILLDTDMESDVDDVGALAMLHALADRGEAEILGVMVSAKNPYATLTADRINTYFGRPDLPLGMLKGEGVDRDSLYAHHIAEEFPGQLESADDAPDAVALSREILSEQPDRSVVLVTIGYKTNVRDLLFSEPCEHSDLTGAELIEQKVRIWACMGGYFPEGREANIVWDYEASYEAISNWPTDIVFSGWEIGRFIYTGGPLYQLPEDSPVRRSYQLFNNIQPHRSWDQSALLYAIRGLDERPATDYWDFSEPGRIVIDPESGTNRWERDPDGTHRHKIERRDPNLIADEINVLMMHQPKENDE